MKRKYFEKLGRLAYEAYCGEVGWKSVRGEPLPAFLEQSSKLQEAWIFTARAIYNATVKDWANYANE